MLTARIGKASALKAVIDSVKEIVPQGVWGCDEGGVAMYGMDASHVALCYLHLRPAFFESYTCEQHLSLAFSLENLAKILKCAANDDSVTLTAARGADKMTIVFESPAADKISTFDFKLMDIEGDQIQMPPMEYACNVSLGSKLFRSIITDMSQVGDSCSLACDAGSIQFATKGGIGAACTTLVPSATLQLQATSPTQLTGACSHLIKFTKATPLSDVVHVSMGADAPIRISYPLEHGEVTFHLAPKVIEE